MAKIKKNAAIIIADNDAINEAAEKAQAVEISNRLSASDEAYMALEQDQLLDGLDEHPQLRDPLYKGEKFVPIVGEKASIFDGGKWWEVFVTKISRGIATFYTVGYDESDTETCDVSALEQPFNFTVAKRMENYAKMINFLVKGQINCLLALGKTGVGKSHIYEEIFGNLGWERDKDYALLKGHISPLGLYQLLYDFNGKIIVIDDTDTAFESGIANKMMLAASDTKKNRIISWNTTSDALGEYPQSFTFTGRFLVLSNKNVENAPPALIGRARLANLHLTPDEVVVLCRILAPKMGAMLPAEDVNECLLLLEKYATTLGESLSLRTFRFLLDDVLLTRDLEIARANMLNFRHSKIRR
jgi:hypothetical protein